MKKVVIFTLAMVVVFSGMAFAQTTVEADNNTVPIALGSGATAVAVPITKSLNDNNLNSGTQVDADVKVDDSLNNNRINSPSTVTKTATVTKTDVDVEVEDSLNGNRINSPSTEIKVEDSLNNNKVAFGGGVIAGRDTNPDNKVFNIVDNAVLANVNTDDMTLPLSTITFTKSQNATISGSFSGDGVSNTNSAAGNMNNQKASTSIAVSFASSGGRGR